MFWAPVLFWNFDALQQNPWALCPAWRLWAQLLQKFSSQTAALPMGDNSFLTNSSVILCRTLKKLRPLVIQAPRFILFSKVKCLS